MLITLSLLYLSSCNNTAQSRENSTDSAENASSPEDTTKTGSGGTRTFITNDELNTLYVINDGSNSQLAKLLKDNNNGKDKKKLIFQIYRDGGGFLRLLVIPSKEKNGKYFLTDTLQPLPSKIVQTKFSNTDVNLSDLQLTDVDPFYAITSLRANIGNPKNDPEWKFIWFVPVIKRVRDDDPTPSPFVKDYLKYQILHSDGVPVYLPDQDALTENKKFKVANTTIVPLGEANPSPPRQLQ